LSKTTETQNVEPQERNKVSFPRDDASYRVSLVTSRMFSGSDEDEDGDVNVHLLPNEMHQSPVCVSATSCSECWNGFECSFNLTLASVVEKDLI